MGISNSNFSITPYSLKKLQQVLAAANKAGPAPIRPLYPDSHDPKFANPNCPFGTGNCVDAPDPTLFAAAVDQYNKDLRTYQLDQKAWQDNAYAGLAQAAVDASAGKPVILFRTDLFGQAAVTLPLGTWYITGQADPAANQPGIVWDELAVTVTQDTSLIELNSSNGRSFTL